MKATLALVLMAMLVVGAIMNDSEGDSQALATDCGPPSLSAYSEIQRVTRVPLASRDDGAVKTVADMTYVAIPLASDSSASVVVAHPVDTEPDEFNLVAVNGIARGQTSLPAGGIQDGIDLVLDCR